jgi:hypothetical protein
MARVPVIESPCPIAGFQLPRGATEHCTLCDRSVHNLDRKSARERTEFMNSCSGMVCVAYTVRVPMSSALRKHGLGVAAVVGTMAAAALVSLPVAADESLVTGMSAIEGDANQLPNCDDGLMEVVTTGGVLRADQAEWVDDGKDAPPDLPSIEDDGK